MNREPSHASILAVDDTPANLKLLGDILTPGGYQVRLADSGELALAAAASSPPDLILLDVHMPGLDGIEVCRRLKACEAGRSIPVILISAFGDVKEAVAGLQLGAADYISKPFQAEELLARVRVHLTLAQQSAALQQAHAELEQRVAVRTQELQQANEQLRAKITELKLAEEDKEKLEAQNRQLQKSESLFCMAGAIAHHFNNQLHAVMMNLELAMGEVPRQGAVTEHLNVVMQAARKAAQVSSQMLAYLGQTHGQLKLLDLSVACQQLLPMLRASMPRGLVLEPDLPSPGPIIHADASQMQQVLTNLVTNAWEASGDTPGAIRLAVRTVSVTDIPAQHRFPIACPLSDRTYACLEVADTGCGIPEKAIEKLFDPFFTTKLLGRGLGLPVILGIVRAGHGAITVESKPGWGSIFRVFLPVSAEVVPSKSIPPGPASQMPALGQSAGNAQAGTILLVEDEPFLRKSVALLLQRLGFTVLAAADGVEAVALFQQHQAEVRVVLSDLTMPRMNGWATLSALRKLSPGLPVILASGYSETQAMEGYHPEKPQAFLGKPYGVVELRETLARVLERGERNHHSCSEIKGSADHEDFCPLTVSPG